MKLELEKKTTKWLRNTYKTTTSSNLKIAVADELTRRKRKGFS